MTSEGNVADTGILAEANQLIAEGFANNICEALEKLMNLARRDNDIAKMQRIKTTQKAKRCRHSRKNKLS